MTQPFKSLVFMYQYSTWQAGKDKIFSNQKNANQYGLRSKHYHLSNCCNDILVAW